MMAIASATGQDTRRLPPRAGGLQMLLGPLEAAVMRVAWRLPPASSLSSYREALAELESRALATSTVQTTLNRLVEKGLLTRSTPTRAGRRPQAYYYQPALSEEELRTRIIDSVLTRLVLLADGDHAVVAERLASLNPAH